MASGRNSAESALAGDQYLQPRAVEVAVSPSSSGCGGGWERRISVVVTRQRIISLSPVGCGALSLLGPHYAVRVSSRATSTRNGSPGPQVCAASTRRPSGRRQQREQDEQQRQQHAPATSDNSSSSSPTATFRACPFRLSVRAAGDAPFPASTTLGT